MPSPVTKTKAPSNETPQSCVQANVNVRSCLNFDVMWKAHPLNWSPPEPTPFRHAPVRKSDSHNPFDILQEAPPPPIYADQCAIKMSIALQEGGVSLETYPKNRSEYRDVYAIKKKYRGALAAEELANWLIKVLGEPTKLPPNTAQTSVQGKKGIIFFKNFWQRPGEVGNQGDHIDLWDGSTTPYADPRQYGNGPDNYFRRSEVVWFWELQ